MSTKKAKRIAPLTVRFIKLGTGGEWEPTCIEKDQTIRLGYKSPLHDQSLTGKWNRVFAYWKKERGGAEGTARSDVRQIRDFYEQPKTTLWFTFYKRRLWWAFASEGVSELPDKSRIRKVIGAWTSSDVLGKPLAQESLDGRVTRVAGYRGTICSLPDRVAEYLVRRINGDLPDDVVRAEAAISQLQDAVDLLVRGLHWKDFELLTELLFSRAGYRRVSVVGKTEKAIDIDLESPVTGRKAFVQVKSQASRQAFDKCVADYESMPQYDEFFFVCHSPSGLDAYGSDSPDVHLLTGPRLARLLIDAGLVGFLISKRS